MNTPRYEYSRTLITQRIALLQSLQAPYGLTIRYALKANPHQEIVNLMSELGLHFDASSSYEATELLAAGVPGSHISLSSQQSPHNLETLLENGVQFIATSLQQLQLFLAAPNRQKMVGVRINPNVGYGHNKRTSTGGVAASFGIWHEYIPEVLRLASAEGVLVSKLHIHVGSGADPKVWGEVMEKALELVDQLQEVKVLDIGGGFKVHRYGDEKETDMQAVMTLLAKQLQTYEAKTGRALRLEIEPGTYMIARAGTLVATVDDIVDTGTDGYTFLRLNTGMNDFLRSALYGAQHKIEVMNGATSTKAYIVVGHNCESGDIFTPAPGNPEGIEERILNEAQIGDEVRVYDTGAYCASMRAKGYNSFPDAVEIMVE